MFEKIKGQNEPEEKIKTKLTISIKCTAMT